MNSSLSHREALHADLHAWIAAIATPDARRAGKAPGRCARLAKKVAIGEREREAGEIGPADRPFDVIVYVLPAELGRGVLLAHCDTLNVRYPALLFLGDPRDRHTNINGVTTNNGKHNLILCQPKAKLRAARQVLAKTDYYQYWESEYLREILGSDFGEVVGDRA